MAYPAIWLPVRDEACLACGLLCRSYPEQCRSELDTLWERWTEQLTGTIWSIRQDAAVALGDALNAYGNNSLVKICNLIGIYLYNIMPEAADPDRSTNKERIPVVGVWKREYEEERVVTGPPEAVIFMASNDASGCHSFPR